MFTTGTKFLVGSTVIAIVSAIVYGVTQDGVMGTVGLSSAAGALGFLTGVNIFTRDANVFVTDDLIADRTPAAQLAPPVSGWPLVVAVGVLVMVVGLVTYQAVFLIGLLVMFVGGAEWTLQVWAERASADSVYNAEVRSRLTNPFEFPVAGAAVIGVVVFSFSRVMLWLSKTNTVLAFGVLASVVLLFAFVFAARPGIKSRGIIAVVFIGILGIVAGGTAAGVSGEREIEVHETTEGEAAEGICENPEETEADEKASQKVAASASVAAIITLSEDGTLSYEVNGPPPAGQEDTLFLQRSNPNNVIFKNRSDEERRLSVNLGTTTIAAQEGEGAGEGDGEDEVIPNQACTTLVKPGGEQNITLNIAQPSIAFPDAFGFFVPGVPTAELGLYVP